MGLDYESNANGATPQYNGNIAAMQWRTNLGGTCLTRQQYRFSYDYANRLTAADHWTHNGTVWTNTNNYSESNITFDLNGNIKTYTRRGLVTAPSTYGVIDQLTYTYGDAARPDRLTNMVDAGSITQGFKYTAGAAAYAYDANGNMTQDNHKGFTFGFNFLNLPQSFTQGSNVITMTYTADGEKLTKAVTGGGATKNYVGGIEYAGANLEAIYFGEGRCTPNGATAFNYDYTVKDHLGNARVNFRANGAAITVLESLHYYPFGMLMEGIGTNTPTNDYSYNGKELNEDFGLNLYDYGARWYDASLGRWWSVDPMANKYVKVSGYVYGVNNPLRYIDPDGKQIVAPAGNPITYEKDKDGNPVRNENVDVKWSENATKEVIEVGNEMLKTEEGKKDLDLMVASKSVDITIRITAKRLKDGTHGNTSGKRNGDGSFKKANIVISTAKTGDRFDSATRGELLNAVGVHESIHALATGEQATLDKKKPNSWEAETSPINHEYESRLQYLDKQGKTLNDSDRDRYENPNFSDDGKDKYNNPKPSFYGLDKNGEARTQSRYEKKE